MNDDELIEHARRKVDAELEGMDKVTRLKLAATRRAALDQLAEPARGMQPGWLPVGAAAAVALVAVGVALGLRTPAPDAAAEAPSELEVMLGDDDPALYDDELEFYAWLDEQQVAPPPAGDDAG
jgi:hypothetical protein